MDATLYQIRIAHHTDLGALPAIESAAASLFPVGRIPDSDHTIDYLTFKRGLDANLLWVACETSIPVGFALCEQSNGYLHLAELSVHPRHGKQGIGRALLQHVLQSSSALTSRGVTLTTFSDLDWNGPFYETIGFATVPPHAMPKHITDALAHEHALGMVKRIGMIWHNPEKHI